MVIKSVNPEEHSSGIIDFYGKSYYGNVFILIIYYLLNKYCHKYMYYIYSNDT